MEREAATRRSKWLCALVAGAAFLVAPAGASAALTFDNVPSSIAASVGSNVTFTMTVGNTGPNTQNFKIGTLETRWFGEKAVQNPYQSITSTTGTCTIDPVNPPYNYHGATCDLNLAAGESATITAVVKLNESMDHLAGVLDSQGAFSTPFKSASVQAIYPARVDGSDKIKLKNLPDTCVEKDFELTASAKGAKKITAKLAGPYDEWHGSLYGDSFSNKIAAEKGKKLKVDVPLAKERAGFYDLQFSAKFENGPKQKTEVNIQRCGVPD